MGENIKNTISTGFLWRDSNPRPRACYSAGVLILITGAENTLLHYSNKEVNPKSKIMVTKYGACKIH